MADPFVAEVKIFAGNFAPRGWSFCNGQLLNIADNTALFSLVGTTFGGDGRQTLGLPNLQGRAPMHPGRGPGLTPRQLGETGGVENVTLTAGQMASHRHDLSATMQPGNSATPVGAYLAADPDHDHYREYVGANDPPLVGMAPVSEGGGQSHTNMQPILALNYIIALVGQYPSRA